MTRRARATVLAAAIGEQTGANNAARLQQQIAATQQQHSDDPMKANWRRQARQAEFRASDAGQERLARIQN